MILVNNDLSGFVEGVKEGRAVFDNLKKCLTYSLSSTMAEISPFIAFVCLQIPLSLTAVLVVLLDVGTDVIPTISLACEEPESDIMSRPPRNAQTHRLVSPRLYRRPYLEVPPFAFFILLLEVTDGMDTARWVWSRHSRGSSASW